MYVSNIHLTKPGTNEEHGSITVIDADRTTGCAVWTNDGSPWPRMAKARNASRSVFLVKAYTSSPFLSTVEWPSFLFPLQIPHRVSENFLPSFSLPVVDLVPALTAAAQSWSTMSDP